jgi:putative FmdB family regulatory protein
MPTYEYRCENGHQFEVIQRMADDAVTECTVCGAPVQRVFHPVAVHFKGSGFYNTDYGKKKGAGDNSKSESGKSESSDSSSSGDGGGKESKGSDSTGSDSKSSDSKGSDSKGSDSKSSSDSKSKSSSGD